MNYLKFVALFCLSISTQCFGQVSVRDTFETYLEKYQNHEMSFISLKDTLSDFFSSLPDDDPITHYEKVFKRSVYFWEDRSSLDSLGVLSTDLYTKRMIEYLDDNSPICHNGDRANWEYHFDPAYSTASGHYAGIITGIYMNPINSSIIVAGSGASGIWFTSDGGDNWENVTDHLRVPALGIREIIDISKPSEPVGKELLAITGKDKFGDSYGIGVLRSSDFGASWTRNNIPDLNGKIEYLVDASKPKGETDIIFAVSRRKLYETSDRGITWSAIDMPVEFDFEFEANYSLGTDDIAEGLVYVSTKSTSSTSFCHLWTYNFTTDTWMNKTSTLQSAVDEHYGIDVDGTEYFEDELNFLGHKQGYTEAFDGTEYFFDVVYETHEFSKHARVDPVYNAAMPWLLESPSNQQWFYYDYGGAEIEGDYLLSCDATIPVGAKIKIYIGTAFAGEWSSADGTYSPYSLSLTDFDPGMASGDRIEFRCSFDAGLGYDTGTSLPIYIDNVHIEMFRLGEGVLRVINVSDGKDEEVNFLVNSHRPDELNLDLMVAHSEDKLENIEILHDEALTLGVSTSLAVEYGVNQGIYFGGVDFLKYSFETNTITQTSTKHVDVRSIQVVKNVDGENQIVVGDDGGVSFSEDNGQTWTSLNGNFLPITQFYGFGINPHDHSTIIGGTQDNNTFIGDHPDWMKVFEGDGGHSGFSADPMHDDWYYGQQNAAVSVVRPGFTDVDYTDPIADEVMWFTGMPIEIDPIEGNTLFCGYEKKGNDPGEANSAVIGRYDIDYGAGDDSDNSIGFEFGGNTQKVGAIEVCPANSNVIYVGMGENKEEGQYNKFYISNDYGVSFTDITGTLGTAPAIFDEDGSSTDIILDQLLHWKNINSIESNPSNDQELWIGISGVYIEDGEAIPGKMRVLHSENGGILWHDYSLGLPPFPINDLLYQKGTNNRLFAATDAGVFYREDGMDEWVCFQEGMPATFVTDLEIDYCTQTLYASTFGRGIWRSSIDLPDTEPVIVDSDLTWGGTQTFEHNIIIESGNTLTINGTIQMAGTKKIVVEPGARLKIDGGTLTSACDVFWSGVEVHGVSSLEQTAANQGVITLLNNATIENAEVAVALWEPGNWSSTGGIIYSTQSSFVNNRKDVEFVNYQNYNLLSGEPVPSVSYFRNTDFNWNDSFFDEFPLGHITMYKVDGVRFTACAFKDDRTDPESRYFLDYAKNNSGIYSLDSKYFLLPGCSDISGCTGSIEDDPDWIPTTFENLDFGVYASNISTEQNITVDRAIFENNLYGIQIVNVNNPVITRNRFDVNSDPTNNFTATTQRGIHAVRSKGLMIEENEFTHLSGLNPVQGIVCSDLGESDERIYNNFFRELDYGIITQGKNRLYDPTGIEDGLKGLEFTCEENVTNKQDHRVLGNLWGGSPDPTFGVKSNNGLPDKASGNIFSAETPLEVGEHYNNISTNLVRYYYYNLSPVEDPIDVAGPFMKVPTEFVNTCPSELEDNSNQDHSSGFITTTQINFNTYSADLENKKVNYHSLVNGGDTDVLMDEIDGLTRDNRDTLHALLLSYSPYLTEDIVRATVNHPITKYPHAWAYELVEENIEVAYQPGFMDFLATKTYPLPQFMIDDIQALLDSNASTDMLTKQLELAELESKKAYAANLLLQSLKNDTISAKIDSIRYWIDAKDDILEQTRIIDTYIQNGDFVDAETNLSDMALNIQNYPTHLRDELNDFIDFKSILLANLIANIPLDSISETDFNEVLLKAENGVGIGSYQAKEFLCFFFDQCYDYPVTLVGQGFMAPIQSNQEIETVNTERQFKVYPNPAGTWLAIELPAVDSDLEITVIDLTGRLVYEKSIKGSGGTSRSSLIEIWDTNLIGEGNYLITITNADGSINYGTQMVTIHR